MNKQVITKAQIKAIFTVLTHYGITKEDLYQYFADLGWGKTEDRISIKALTDAQIEELFQMIENGFIGHIKYRAYKPADGMICPTQLRYAEFLWYHFCKGKNIPKQKYDSTFRSWLDKYHHIDELRFCDKHKATQIISALEHLYITSFGVDAFARLTQKQWPKENEKYKKYK